MTTNTRNTTTQTNTTTVGQQFHGGRTEDTNKAVLAYASVCYFKLDKVILPEQKSALRKVTTSSLDLKGLRHAARKHEGELQFF